LRAALASIGGVETRYFFEGTSGPRVLLIHGVGMSGAGWLRNIDALSTDFQVCAPDLLGNGLTHWGDYPPGPPHPHVLQHLADFVDHLGWRRFSVVGSSFGALLAALLYLRMPDRVEKLVGISSASFIASDEELAVAMKESYANGSSAVLSPTLETCRRRLERICFDPAAVPPELVFMQLTEYAVPWAKRSYEQRMQGMMDVAACRPYRVQHRLEELRLACLLLWGLNDPRAHYARAKEAVARMPDAHLIAFERCKHFPHIEHPAKFNGLVRSFLLEEGKLPTGVI
jgi:pimeloyl-ACP methyl ester carboxylesterase